MPWVAAVTFTLLFIDSAWAIPANTVLIFLIGLSNRRLAKHAHLAEQRANRAVTAATEAHVKAAEAAEKTDTILAITDRRERTVTPHPMRRKEDHE